MECDKIQNQLSAYIDQELSDQDKTEVELHLAECEECQKAYDDINRLITDLHELARIELPKGFHGEFMEKLRNEEKANVKPRKQMFNYKLPQSVKSTGLIAASLVATVFMLSAVFVSLIPEKTPQLGTMTGSSAAASRKTNTGSSLAVAETPETAIMTIEEVTEELEEQSADKQMFMADAGTGSMKTEIGIEPAMHTSPENSSGRKAIVNHRLSIKVEDLQNTIQQITDGSAFVKSSEINYYDQDKTEGYAAFVLTVGSVDTDDYLEYIKSLGETLSEDETQTQRTSEYLDLQARITAAETELDRLNKLITNSKTLTTMIYVEDRISEVSRQLDSYKGQLYYIENTTSTPEIQVSFYAERERVQPIVTLHSRVKEGFNESSEWIVALFQNIVIFIASAFVPFMLLVIVFVVCYILGRQFRKRGGSK